MEKEKQKLVEEYGNKLCKIMCEVRYNSLGSCDAEEVKDFAKKCFCLGEKFKEKIINKIIDKAELEINDYLKNFGLGDNRDIDKREKLVLKQIPIKLREELNNEVSAE